MLRLCVVLGFWMVCSVQHIAMNDHCATTRRIEKFQCGFYFVFADPFQMVIMVASRIKDARKKVGAKFSPPTSNKKQFHCKCLQGPQFLLCILYSFHTKAVWIESMPWSFLFCMLPRFLVGGKTKNKKFPFLWLPSRWSFYRYYSPLLSSLNRGGKLKMWWGSVISIFTHE